MNGVETPRLETRQGFDVDGIEYKVAFDCGVSALDFRGVFKNAGKIIRGVNNSMAKFVYETDRISYVATADVKAGDIVEQAYFTA